MGALPKRRVSSARQGERRSHLRAGIKASVLCPQCRKPHLPHRVCLSCGYYNGKDVLKLESKASKKKKAE